MLPDDLMLDLAFPLMDSDFAGPSSLVEQPATKADWFLAPETWRVSYSTGTSATMPVGRATMKNYVTVVQSWFERWVTTGSNPFIHARLYGANFPACVQVAYATLASYNHRTPANTDAVLQIVEDRSNTLIQENRIADGEDQDVDLFAQLTRLHALLVYQIIGLFDGDIRSRYVAEAHMAVQRTWAGELIHSAAKIFPNTSTNIASNPVACLPKPVTSSQQQWYLWILSESIRRTYLIAISICSVFCALQQRWAACPGTIMYTNRAGLWDATSATEWDKHCTGKHGALLHRFECVRSLDYIEPADIDEFGSAMLDMAFNGELLETWRDRGRC